MGKYIPKFYCGTIVGGLSAQKQNRVLRKVPHILVATPGRLWDLVSTNSDYLKLIRQVEFLVFDEADRMLQTGRFKEVQQLLPVLDKHIDNMPKPASRQTFIFSATLPPSLKAEPTKSKKDKKPKEVGIQYLLKSINFRDSKPFYLNLTKEDQGLASKLIESRIDCLLADKFLYLYYLLLRYPGRTICFVNSIDTIRRLTPQLELLGIKAYPLHAEMQQKQRLKNVDRFKTLDNVVLVASDVAARGLDIPLVDHVIHYQLPRTVDLYIHRSGRTARGSQSGISIMLTCPEELKSYTMICRHLEKERVDHFNIDNLLVKKLKPRVALAQEIDKLMHSGRKEKANRNWIEQQAEKLDIILDEDFIGKVKKSEDHQEIQATTQRKIHKLKEQLNRMLNDKIIQVGHSTKYLTKFYGSNSDLLQNIKQQKTEAFDASEKRSAITDAKKRKLKK
jgi:ATP-dependent RNA helicase DDX24/MAK5